MNKYRENLSIEEDFLHKLTLNDNIHQGIPPSLDDVTFLSLCKKQKLSKLAANNLLSGPFELKKFSPPLHNQLKQALMLHDHEIALYQSVLKEIIRLLEEINVSPIVMKGPYQVDGMIRDFGDLDLLVPKKSIPTIHELMLNKGFNYVGYDRNLWIKKKEKDDIATLLEWSNQFEYLHPKTSLLIEFHSDFFEPSRVYPIYLAKFLEQKHRMTEQACFNNKLNCKQLLPMDRLWLMCMHTALKRSVAKHSFCLRNILIIFQLSSYPGIDWQFFLEQSYKTDTLPFVIYSLQLTKSFYPCPDIPDLSPWENKLTIGQKLMIRFHHKAYVNFAKTNRIWCSFYRYLEPLVTPSPLSRKIRSLTIIPLFFAPPWSLRKTYSLKRHSPLVFLAYPMEPFRWSFRLIRKVVRMLRRG
ncbi:MAG: nucleotidyltransferase family protein [Spirochaetales bacterium]|nr:nucleotidyltransferase family protein [Spirochaetales bacterium]